MMTALLEYLELFTNSSSSVKSGPALPTIAVKYRSKKTHA